MVRPLMMRGINCNTIFITPRTTVFIDILIMIQTVEIILLGKGVH